MSSTDGDQPTLSAAELTSLVSTLQVELLGLKSRVSDKETQIDSLRETILNLSHENELLKRRIYGNKTERTGTSELQLTLGNLLDDEKLLQKKLDEAIAEAQEDAQKDEEAPTNPAVKAKPRGRRDLSASSLPRVTIEIVDEELEESAKRIGFDDTHQLMFRRGGWAVLVKRVAKYEVPGKDGPTVLGVPVPKTLFPRGLLHSSAVAHVIVQKFGLGVPHHRLEQHIEGQGVSLDRGTMCRYTDEAGGALGATVVHAMWQDALNNAYVISTDATSGMVQPEPRPDGVRQACKKGHFFTAVVDCDHVLFAYTEQHTQEFVKKLFGGFKGYLQSDASNVYDILDRGPPKDTEDGVTLVGCFAHCRRYFFEAAICKYAVGVQGLLRMRTIYAADDAFRKFPPARRKLKRDEHVRPLIDDFFNWVEGPAQLSRVVALPPRLSATRFNQQHELRRVLDDGRLPLDNTRSERALRKIVVGREKVDVLWQRSPRPERCRALHHHCVISPAPHRARAVPRRSVAPPASLAPGALPRARAKLWKANRDKLDAFEIDQPLGPFTIPEA